VIGGAVDPADVGPLYHHGPELLPFVDLIFGAGLPVVAAVWLARWQSIRARLPGAGQRAGRAGTRRG
jgi:hypothetical protein